MSKELVALVFKFLSEKDGTCAEIFKRGFEPDLECIENWPSLAEIVDKFVQSKKIAEKPPAEERSHASHEDKIIMAVAQKNPSDFLERIVQKRIDKKNDSDTESQTDESSEKETTSNSDSEDEIVESAHKRRKMNNSTKRNIWSTLEIKKKKKK